MKNQLVVCHYFSKTEWKITTVSLLFLLLFLFYTCFQLIAFLDVWNDHHKYVLAIEFLWLFALCFSQPYLMVHLIRLHLSHFFNVSDQGTNNFFWKKGKKKIIKKKTKNKTNSCVWLLINSCRQVLSVRSFRFFFNLQFVFSLFIL